MIHVAIAGATGRMGRNLLEAFWQGGEALTQAFAPGGSQRTKGAAMKAAAKGDDFVGIALFDAAHVAARQLDASLVGLCA